MAELNDSQKRRVLATLAGLHQSLADLEALLAQADERSSLSAFHHDLSPTQAKVIRDYFSRIRSEIQQAVERLHIHVRVRRVNLSWHLQTCLITEDVAIAEISPDRLRGYGQLDPAAAELVGQIEDNLSRAIAQLQKFLRQFETEDLQARIRRLEERTPKATDLAKLERMITKHGLVEFRPLLDQIIRRLESPRFEIAVFGRVNTGKSSLLNHILGHDLLPVGVNPVTATPTHLMHGDQAFGIIRFAEAERRQIDLSELREYVTETENPGNAKRVIEVLVQFPSPNLPPGIILVDTPGTGSLATSGSAETFAYLPRCDHAIALIDAGTTLTQDDLRLLRRLYESAIPASVLLSKADLLSPSDLTSTTSYIESQLEREFGFQMRVCPVSTVGASESLLFQWFDEHLRPEFARFKTVVEQALRRKIGHLRESVIAALNAMYAERETNPAGRLSRETVEIRTVLETTGKATETINLQCRNWLDDSGLLSDAALSEAADRVRRAGLHDPPNTGQFVTRAVANCLIQRGADAYELVAAWKQTLAQSLADIHRSVPALESIDSTQLREFVLSGLPMVDADSLESRLSRLDRRVGLRGLMGQSIVKRFLLNRYGEEVQHEIKFYDCRLRAWLNDNVTQILELFDSQVELARHWLRARAVTSDDATSSDAKIQELESDLQQLTGNNSASVPKQHEAAVQADSDQPPSNGSNGWKPDDDSHSAAKVKDDAQPDDKSGSGGQIE